jgi:predicted RNase H-like nuclease (RuvC/YqgF family)
MAEACRVMARDLGFEKAKVQELESRLSEVYPNIENLLQHLAPGERNRAQLNDEGVNGHLLLENQRQREFIFSLETNLREREEAIRVLKSRPEERMQELQLASFGQHQPDQLIPNEMTRCMSEQSSVEIITGNPFSFTQEAKESCT